MRSPSNQQDQALRAVAKWFAESGPQVFYLGGFAGTGKTTLAKHFAASISDVLFCAFTGKASLVMQRKGCVGAQTIHSLIYSCTNDRGMWRFALNPDSAVGEAKLVIVDECSMVGEVLASDLLSFGTKVLVLGDPAQLPPVDGAGYFTSREPDFMLTEIHRQAAENPIIRMSMDVREGRKLKLGAYGTSKVITTRQLDWADALVADEVLVGLNRTRKTYNEQIRKLRGLPPEVSPTDKLICLKNNHGRGLLNGGLWRVESVSQRSPLVRMVVLPIEGANDNPLEIKVNPLFFEMREQEIDWRVRRDTDEFYFGEAITVHKAQGSQWDSVLVFDESKSFRDDARRHLYTAITRAAEKVTVVLPSDLPPPGAASFGGLR